MWDVIKRYTTRAWVLYLIMGLGLSAIFNRVQAVDDILNAGRPSGDYVVASSYGFKPLDNKELRKALAYNEALLSTNPGLILAFENAGFCYFYLNKVKEAIKSYRDAISRNKYIYSLYFDLGFVYMAAGEYKLAQVMYEEGGRLIPRSREQWFKILNISPKYKDYPSLQENSLFARRLDYDRQMYYIYTCTLFGKVKDFRSLLSRAIDGIAQYPENPQLYYYAGWASLNLGEAKNSVQLLSRAIQLAPNYVEALELRAQIFQVMKREDLYAQDMARSALAHQQGKWEPKKEAMDLHYWHDAILFFQTYR